MIINKIDYTFERFSSGELKLKTNNLKNLAVDNEVTILYNGEISIFELFIVVDFYKQNDCKVNLILSYLPYQRMDKNNGIEVCTIQNVAHLFNKLNLDSLSICEPHSSLQYFNNAKAIQLVSKIYNLSKSEIGLTGTDKLVFTDKGSYDKFSQLGENAIYFEKHRSINTGLIDTHRIIGNIDGANKFVIIDDIISTGDTIISCISYLPKDAEIYIICGHFEQNKYNLRLLDIPQVKKIYSSNSITKEALPKLKLFNIEDLI